MRVAFLLALLWTPCQASLWTWFVFFPSIRCSLRLWLLNFDISDTDRFNMFFREDSVMTVPELGSYEGIDGILEYVLLAGDQSPYFTEPATTEALDFSLSKYDYETGVCTFNVKTVLKQTSDAINSKASVAFRSASMTKMRLDLAQGYLKTTEVLMAPGFWSAIEALQNSEQSRNFVCTVMEGECANVFPGGAPDDCSGTLAALPYRSLGGDGMFRNDENSVSCRTLHAALARTSPEDHCPHVSFSPMEDPKGQIKCQDGYGNGHKYLDFFTPTELNDFEQFILDQGFDESGSDFVLPEGV